MRDSATAFALFLKSQRKWESKDMSQISVEKFKERLKAFGYGPECVLPHGNYLVNLGNPDAYVATTFIVLFVLAKFCRLC